MKSVLFILSFLVLGFSLSTSAAQRGKWTVLFDGDSTEQWRGFRTDDFPTGSWEIKEGVLTSIGGGKRINLITREQFADFELFLEWRVETAGNSGLFYRVSEDVDITWHAAPEIQILDDEQSGNTVHSAGALYDLLPPGNRKVLRPVGEFNTARLIVRGSRAEYWLNGKRIQSYDLEDADLKEKIGKSKFGEFETFGQTEMGFVGLQHHGDPVGFRNIRIRELPSSRN